MIKNDHQLKTAQSKLAILLQEVTDLNTRYGGEEAALYTEGQRRLIDQLEREVDDYKTMRKMSVEEFMERLGKRDIDESQLGEVLARVRIKLGLTQAELAKRLGTKPENISRYEDNSYSPRMRLLQLRKLLRAMGCEMRFRIGFERETTRGRRKRAA